MRVPLRDEEKPAVIVHGGERFARAVHSWLDWLQHNGGRGVRTVDKYAGYLDRLAVWCSSPADDERAAPSTSDPLRLTPTDLERFCGIAAHYAGLTPRSRRPLVAAVRGFFAWYARAESVANPAEQLAYPKFGAPLPAAMSLAEAERMLMTPDIETFTGLRNAAMIAVLIGCGLRISGLVAMNESSLIWHADEEGVEHLTLRVTEKGKKERLVPVPQETALLLRAYLGHVDLEVIDRNIAGGDRVLWISTCNHMVGPHEYHGEARRLSTRTVADMIALVGKRAQVAPRNRHAHAMRHLYGTELTESDVPTLQVQGLMGHVDPKDTEIYTRLAQRRLREAVDRGNPMAKMRAPLLDSLRSISAAQRRPRASPSPNGAYNPQTRSRVGTHK